MTEAVVNVRKARAEDYQRIADLTVSAYINGGHMTAEDGYLQHLRRVAERAEHATLLVAEVDGLVAGSVTVTDYDGRYAEVASPGEMEFRMLAIDPEYQGLGVARQLVRHVVAEAESRPEVTAVTLCSLTSMTAAHRLYRSEGFTEDPSRDFVLITAEKTGRFPFFSRRVRTPARQTRQLAHVEGK